MPRALAIETSGRIGSVALVNDGSVLDAATFPHGLAHAAEILPLIDRLCRQHNWGPADLQEVYISIGPGSFTGLRIGVTLAKTLAFARGVRMVAVPTVRVLVENAPPEARHAIIVLDAKREQIFTARFEWIEQHWVERESARLDSLTAMLARSPRPVWLLGEGLPYHEKFIPNDTGILIAPAATWAGNTAVVARLGAEMARANQFADADRLTPLYIRRPEAEEKFQSSA